MVKIFKRRIMKKLTPKQLDNIFIGAIIAMALSLVGIFVTLMNC